MLVYGDTFKCNDKRYSRDDDDLYFGIISNAYKETIKKIKIGTVKVQIV